jgi:hypothetical protein
LRICFTVREGLFLFCHGGSALPANRSQRLHNRYRPFVTIITVACAPRHYNDVDRCKSDASRERRNPTMSKVDRHGSGEEHSLKGTFVSVMLLAGFIVLTWLGVFALFISRM